ncbi:hypothetical protein SAMN04488052_1159 [Aquisalimonas asiatica]|uniref:Uncharacterized protein n=1 Tax=Aquisalimonas asiatica TaxID=406100 RepID=A0A1H8VSP7_9GAMM|nr:hypothetical protein SAMN04488052_1159 [Aquisalimonas asiatica]
MSVRSCGAAQTHRCEPIVTLPLANPTLDASLPPERDEWWLLMDDVSSSIVSRSGWTELQTQRLRQLSNAASERTARGRNYRITAVL